MRQEKKRWGGEERGGLVREKGEEKGREGEPNYI